MSTCQDKLAKVREQNRLRQAKYAALNSDLINSKKRERRLKKKLENAGIATDERRTPLKWDSSTILERFREEGISTVHSASIRRIARSLDIDSNGIEPWLLIPSKLIKKLRTINAGSVNTQKSNIASILKAIDGLNIPILGENKRLLAAYHRELDVESRDKTKSKSGEAVPSFPSYLRKVRVHFGELSKMYVLASLYQECTLRDNFAVKRVNAIPVEKTESYLYVPARGQIQVYVHEHKTSEAYGSFNKTISVALTKLMNAYMTSNNIEKDMLVFGKNLSQYVSINNKKIGLTGGVTLFRKMRVSTDVPTMNAKQRSDLAFEMGHSELTQSTTYLRPTYEMV